MPFSDVLGDSETDVEAAKAVPRYFAAYEMAFELPIDRPVKVTVVCDRGERFNVETDQGITVREVSSTRRAHGKLRISPNIPVQNCSEDASSILAIIAMRRSLSDSMSLSLVAVFLRFSCSMQFPA